MEIILRKGICILEISELAGATVGSDNGLTPMYIYFTCIDYTYENFKCCSNNRTLRTRVPLIIVESSYIQLTILPQRAWT